MLVVQEDDLTGSQIIELLQEHLASMAEVSPPESIHALDVARLKAADVTFWSVWQGAVLAGCGALKELDPTHAEIKSMRTASQFLRKGVASRMLTHILLVAKRRNYQRLSLETGSMDYFEPARKLYASFDFTYCGPFGDYREDPNSMFMTREV